MFSKFKDFTESTKNLFEFLTPLCILDPCNVQFMDTSAFIGFYGLGCAPNALATSNIQNNENRYRSILENEHQCEGVEKFAGHRYKTGPRWHGHKRKASKASAKSTKHASPS